MSKRSSLSRGYLNRTTDLGRLVAEEDPHLNKYYVGREFYLDKALKVDDPVIFYMGSKGIGKSAILQMVRFEKAQDSNRIINLSPDDLAFSAFANYRADNALLGDPNNGQWLFKSLWDYVLLMELWERENAGAPDRWASFRKLFRSKDEKRIQRLFDITITDKGQAITLTDRILQLVKEVEISAGEGDADIAAKVSIDHEGTGQFRLLAEINHAVKTLPDMLTREYFVLIDDLDQYWVNEANQNAFIAALFLSLRRLSRRPVKFLVSIREDIYRCLPLTDKDKSHDRVCHVEWDIASIQQMIERRVSVATNCKRDDIWGNVFPLDSFAVLVKHSTCKPRELIRLASLCVGRAGTNGHKRVHVDDIKEALRQYSIERLGDLVSEYKFTYPKLDVVLQRFFGLTKHFEFKTVADIATDLAVEALEHGSIGMPWQWAGTYDERAEDFARLLLDIGFLEAKANRTACPQPYDPDLLGPVNSRMWFAVHSMYAPGLRLVGT